MTKELQLPQKRFGGKKRIALLVGAAVLGLALVGFLASLLLRVSAERAQEIALSAAGGGQVVARSMDREGFWNEYTFHISNNGVWYEVEVDSFGSVTDLESSWSGSDWDHDAWYWD